jgi:O-antigen/teichoic acid export membrane protein
MPHLTHRKLRSASVINGSGFMLASLATVLWYFLVVRSYSGEASGKLLLSLSMSGLINLLDLGVSFGLVRVLSAGNERTSLHSQWHYFRSALWVTTLTVLLVGPIAVGWWKSNSFPDLPDIGYFSIVTFAVSTQAILICNSGFKGLCDFKAANLILTGSTLAVYGVGGGTVLIGKDVWIVFLAMACTQLLAACFVVVYANKRLCANTRAAIAPGPGRTMVAYVDLLRISVKFFPQMFTGIFFMHAQRFIIARYAGLNEVAVISFAYSIATRIHSVVNAFLEVIFPMANQLQVQGVKSSAFCIRVGSFSATAYFIGAVIVTGVASLLIPGIFPPLFAYSIGVMFAVAAAPAFHYLNGSGESAQVSVCSILSPLIFLGLAPILHNYFTFGADMLLPIAYSLTMAVMLLQVALLVRRHSKQIATD